MRKRTGARVPSQSSGARGCARTMARWLWAAMLLATAADAWTPPSLPLLLDQPRTRRHTNTIHLHLLGWHLELQENRAIRSPYYSGCQFYKGRVLNEDDSTATVTECEGQLYGLLQVGNEQFVLQPNRKPEGAHVLRRRDVLLSDQTPAYNLTGDTVSDLELDFDDDILPPSAHVRPRHTGHSDTEYFHNRNMIPVTRSLSGVQGLWLEMAIVADHTMMKFHGRERVRHYILALMNIVSAIFNDPSLNSNMTLVINKLYLYEEPVVKYGNVKKSLEAVNKWNYRHLMKLPKESTGWDATVWLTRTQLGGPSGFAPIGGVCSRTRSAAINRDEGLTSAFVIAHELGHLLGLTHDGDEQCETAALKGSVMAPTVLATLHNYAWSTCSKEQFHEKSRKWWCLLQRSSDDGVELGGAKELPKYVFTMDEQCRSEFGEGFSVCKLVKVKSKCSRLWCAHWRMPLVCHSKQAPPLEGTPCGPKQWCVDQVCEPMPGHAIAKHVDDNRINRVDSKTESNENNNNGKNGSPAWSEWSPWGNCSAECGYGTKTRIRRCRYKGSISESACEGAGSQVATCWAGVACTSSRDIRADICHRQASRFIPHVHPDESKQCEIWCKDYNGGDASTFGALPDGTPCSYQRPYDVCFQGSCVKGQCNASDTTCNFCPDDYCYNFTHYYTKQLDQGWTRLTTLPHRAQQISVRITTPIAISIAFRERKKDKHIIELSRHHTKRFEVDQKENNYLKYDPAVPQNLQIVEVDSNVIDIKEGDRFGWEGSVVTSGTLMQWNQTDTDIVITSVSRLLTDLTILAIPEQPIEETISVQVHVNYSSPGRPTRPLEYRWSTERGPCSVSCGGGVRVYRPRCWREQRCAPARYEACNTHSCEFAWSAGEWEYCSATCGDQGVQERQLFCVASNISISSRRDLIRNSVSPALCPHSKPDKQQPCNRFPCPVYWQEMPWTPCSTTCGRGVSRRPLFCPASNEMLCGPKPRERRRRCRQRRCPTTCLTSDTTRYCELFTLEQLRRHCDISRFRKECCNACRASDVKHKGNG